MVRGSKVLRLSRRCKAPEPTHIRGAHPEIYARDADQVEAGALVAAVDTPFELLFRLTGPRALRVRVGLRGGAAGDEVVPVVLERRFAVDVFAPPEVEEEPAPGDASKWLESLPGGGVREVFAHIERFGAINEADATRMLGGPRQFRSFSRRFEEYADGAPFELRIDASSGQKRYLRS